MGKVLDRQDTWKGSAWVPGTQNRYSYVYNNPVNFVDPTGHTPKFLIDRGGGGSIGNAGGTTVDPGSGETYTAPPTGNVAELVQDFYASTATEAISQAPPQTSGSIIVLECSSCVASAGHTGTVVSKGTNATYYSFATRDGDVSLNTVPGAMHIAQLAADPDDVRQILAEVNEMRKVQGLGLYDGAVNIPNISGDSIDATTQYLLSRMKAPYNVLTNNCAQTVSGALSAAGIANTPPVMSNPAYMPPDAWFVLNAPRWIRGYGAEMYVP